MRVATAILAVLIGAGPAPAQWRDATETDSTGKKIAMQRTPGKGALSKSNREVTSNLYLRCDNPYDNRVKYRGHDYWSAFVLFSEPVSSVEARTRYSFDGGETTEFYVYVQPERDCAVFHAAGRRGQRVHKTIGSVDHPADQSCAEIGWESGYHLRNRRRRDGASADSLQQKILTRRAGHLSALGLLFPR